MDVADRWFATDDAGNGIIRIWESYVDPMIQANAWLVEGERTDLLIDACNGLAPIAALVTSLRSRTERDLVAVITHAHMDHAGGLHEFSSRRGHEAEREDVEHIAPLLRADQIWPAAAKQMEDAGYPPPDVLIERLPFDGFEAATWAPTSTTLTSTLSEGDVLDLGDRRFEVLELPGHTHGSIGLWDESTGTLFSGDAVYAEEPLIDTAPTSDITEYVGTMRRLLTLPADVVHPGHDYSFGRDVLRSVADRYIERRGVADR